MKYLGWIVFILLMLFVARTALAEEKATWFCSEQTAKREGSTLWSCGIGFGLDEGAARQSGMKDAISEFHIICDASIDCDSSKAIVDPKRTACAKDQRGLWKCTQLIVITLENR